VRAWRIHTYLHTRCSDQVTQWGSGFRFGDTGRNFWGCTNLQITATDAPDMTGTTNMWGTFLDATAFNGDLSSWDVAEVTNMNGLFVRASAFNGDISSWNVAKVTNMMNLFHSATAFNGDLSAWSVGSVTVCPGFCFGGSSSICGVPTFSACTEDPGCTGGRTIQTYGGSSACSCPAGQTGTPGTNAVCGTNSLVRM
jgi:surface protein